MPIKLKYHLKRNLFELLRHIFFPDFSSYPLAGTEKTVFFSEREYLVIQRNLVDIK